MTALVGCSQDENSVVQPSDTPNKPAPDNIVDIAVNDPALSTFVTALTAAGLAGDLQGDGPFTVFAPTNAAFDDLLPGTVDFLLEPENVEILTAILQYHVAAGEFRSADAHKLNEIETLQRPSLKFNNERGLVFVDYSQITDADLKAKNGVVHIIDAVLIPESLFGGADDGDDQRWDAN
jgi:uncharacterized surface protein with fasciclin (FAS1) repeats